MNTYTACQAFRRHSQLETLDEVNRNLKEVIALLLEDGEPQLEAEFVGIQTVVGLTRAEAATLLPHRHSRPCYPNV